MHWCSRVRPQATLAAYRSWDCVIALWQGSHLRLLRTSPPQPAARPPAPTDTPAPPPRRPRCRHARASCRPCPACRSVAQRWRRPTGTPAAACTPAAARGCCCRCRCRPLGWPCPQCDTLPRRHWTTARLHGQGPPPLPQLCCRPRAGPAGTRACTPLCRPAAAGRAAGKTPVSQRAAGHPAASGPTLQRLGLSKPAQVSESTCRQQDSNSQPLKQRTPLQQLPKPSLPMRAHFPSCPPTWMWNKLQLAPPPLLSACTTARLPSGAQFAASGSCPCASTFSDSTPDRPQAATAPLAYTANSSGRSSKAPSTSMGWASELRGPAGSGCSERTAAGSCARCAACFRLPASTLRPQLSSVLAELPSEAGCTAAK